MSKPPPKLITAIRSAMRQMNYHYGRGEVDWVDWGNGQVHINVKYAGPRNRQTVEKRSFRFDAETSTLYFLGHSKVVRV